MSDSLFDSAKSWIGDVQVGWELTPLKHFTGFINGAAFKPDEWQDSGVPIVRIENLNGSTEFNFTRRAVPAKFHVRRGDLLFGWSGNKGTSFGPYLWQHDGHYYLNQHIFRMTGFRGHKGWFYWVLKAVTHEIESRVHGIIGLVHVTRPELGSTLIPVPPAPTQVLISSFLDRGVAAIDDLIAKKERLIELLQEKRQALITQAVTKGLDPNVHLKDSGVEWIGKIPAHWAMSRLGHHLVKIEQGWSPQCESRPAETDEWGVLKVGCVNGGLFDPDENKALPRDLSPLPEYEVRNGELLMSRANTPELVGSAALVENTRARLMLSDKLFRLRANPHTGHPGFLAKALMSRMVRWQIEADASGASSSMQNIGQDTVRRLLLPVPPMAEQLVISNALAVHEKRTETARDELGKSLGLLREYRQALITAAVTGKLDIPGAPEGDVDGQAQRMGI